MIIFSIKMCMCNVKYSFEMIFGDHFITLLHTEAAIHLILCRPKLSNIFVLDKC